MAVAVATNLNQSSNQPNYCIMKNLKKVSRTQMKGINGGALTCSQECCPPPGIKRCPNIYCFAPCPVES
ncbi:MULTISPECIES: bacteriocin-like protein [unclassified Chryseobacterium]|uniref:bacteriocin-like protein n=1 Tax=unclassified Chryseobacterium TaxID=2593645 RepID=UPI00082D4CAD